MVSCAGSVRTVTVLVSGQSNAVGCAMGQGPPTTDDVLMWLNGAWLPASDPVTGFDRSMACEGTVGPWTAFGHALASRKGPGRVVRLVGNGRGSTLISEWDDGRALGEELLQLTRLTRPDVFMFYQGEGDASKETAPQDYENRLVGLMGRVQANAHHPVITVIIGLASSPADGSGATLEGYETIREAQRRAAARVGARFVSAEGLPLESAYHLSEAGMKQLGERLAAQLESVP
jgi:lysophospholipase L1-like esterase